MWVFCKQRLNNNTILIIKCIGSLKDHNHLFLKSTMKEKVEATIPKRKKGGLSGLFLSFPEVGDSGQVF